jgi:hypothetical protein
MAALDLQAGEISFWPSTGIFWALALALAGVLVWRITPERFKKLKWYLVVCAAVFWSLFSILLLNVYWDFYYQYFSFPWARWAAIFNGILYGSVALLFWWLSSRLPIHPVVTFCILAMLESVLEHLLGIYRMGILEKVPALQGAYPLAVFAFAMPEYVLYWGSVLGLAALVQWLRARRAAV